MKKNLLILLIAFCAFAKPEQWKVIGLSGTAYNIEVINDSLKGYFVPSYQIWRHLNFNRSERGDTIIAKFGRNEVKFIKNDINYLLNGVLKSHNHPTINRKGVNYSDINSFCYAMNLLSGLYFNADFSAKEIRVERTKKAVDDRISGIVVIDPGHGGKDPGAIGPGGTNEKDVVLSISLEIKNYLSKYKNIKVYMTREEDVFVPLRERTQFANDKNADLFISIHANASGRSANLGGFKMYFLSEANNEMDEWTAMLENSVLEFEGEVITSGLESVLLSLASSEFIRESQDFAIMLAQSFNKNIRGIQRLHTGVGQANFFVLSGAMMPAVLIETAFISNPREEKMLNDRKFQNTIAESIGVAIADFLKRYSSILEDK
jgi:N-acetylmuramoyl-L-alanine amidase